VTPSGRRTAGVAETFTLLFLKQGRLGRFLLRYAAPGETRVYENVVPSKTRPDVVAGSGPAA
jgi:hypothetical protein